MLQDLACEDRDGCRRCERHGPFRGIDRHSQPFGVHARQHADHPRPADAGEGIARLRPAKGHDLVAGEVVAHIEIEVAPDDRFSVVARTAPCRERTASHEHVLAHGVPDVVRRVVVELAFVGGADGVEVVRAVKRPGVYLAPVLLGDVPPQVTVEYPDHAAQEFQVALRGDEFADLVYENLFLVVHQPCGEGACRRPRLFGRPGGIELPESVGVAAQETAVAGGVATVVCDAVGRGVDRHRWLLHVGRQIEAAEECRRQDEDRRQCDECVFEEAFHAFAIFFARYSVPTISEQVAAADSVTPMAP